MKHADQLMERILFLEGKPAIQLKKLTVGATVGKRWRRPEARDGRPPRPARGDRLLREGRDYVSRDLFRTSSNRRKSISTGWKPSLH